MRLPVHHIPCNGTCDGIGEKKGDRRRRLAEIETANAARKLIEEINKSTDISREDKIKEYQELLERVREMDLMRDENR